MLLLSEIIRLVIFVLLLSAGQVLFKKTALTAQSLTSLPAFTGLLINAWFWSALVLYGAATLLWIMILQKTPLSLAYPFVALGFIIVPVVSWLLFKESVSPLYMAGIALIVAGIGMITLSAQG